MRGVILAGMGRYEEAIVAAAYAIELARDMGRPTSVVLNYSTLPLREVFALDEALARSEEVADNLGPSDFNMPWMNARADVFTAMVMRGDFSRANRAWAVLWDDAIACEAWERWLVSGRLAAVRAELDLATGDTDEAIRWARRAVDMAVASSRRKYDAIARTTLGRALTTSGHAAEAVSELRLAVVTATSLGSPAIVWQARAALADALENGGQDPDAERAEAAGVARSIAGGLAPQRAARFLAEPAVAALLEAST
jgi:tetratricopeptide (TPR) repeat protein